MTRFAHAEEHDHDPPDDTGRFDTLTPLGRLGDIPCGGCDLPLDACVCADDAAELADWYRHLERVPGIGYVAPTTRGPVL